jgi:hypothetical protein
LNFLRNRLPDRAGMMLVFAVCTLPINIWSWVLMFDKVPSLLLSWSTMQVIDALAYMQSLALFESLLFFGLVVFLTIFIPGKLPKERFVSQATLIALCLSIWAVGVHLLVRAYASSSTPETTVWNYSLFNSWCIGCLLLLMGISICIRRWPVLEKWLIERVEQATLLAYLLVSISGVGSIFMIIRNVYLSLLA